MRDPQCRQKWCAMLAKLCAPMDAVTASGALVAMLPLLTDLPDEAFVAGSLAHVASKAKRCPAYADLRVWLDEWWKEHRPPLPALSDDVADLTAYERMWLAYWHRCEREGFPPLREPDGRLSRPDIRDWREHTVSLIRVQAPRVLERIGGEG